MKLGEKGELMDVLSQLASDLFKHLHAMDDEANTPVGYCFHAGLCNYSIYQGLRGRKYEKSWNDRLAELLTDDEKNASREFRYPDSKKKCDIVIKNINGETIWLEVKAVWKRWFDPKTARLSERKKTVSYKGYLFGDAHDHSVAGDIEKLSILDKNQADYVGLVIIGFDVQDDPIDPDMDLLVERMGLKKHGWKIFGPEIWGDRNHEECRYNCWFMGKRV